MALSGSVLGQGVSRAPRKTGDPSGPVGTRQIYWGFYLDIVPITCGLRVSYATTPPAFLTPPKIFRTQRGSCCFPFTCLSPSRRLGSKLPIVNSAPPSPSSQSLASPTRLTWPEALVLQKTPAKFGKGTPDVRVSLADQPLLEAQLAEVIVIGVRTGVGPREPVAQRGRIDGSEVTHWLKTEVETP
jgi:hypothetical protein